MRNDFESNYLAHHGILGMKWGKKNGPPYPLGASDHSASEKKAGYRKSLGGGRNEQLYDRKNKSSRSSKSSSESGEKKEKFHLTDEQKKYIKIGAAVAGTALLAYGSYKLATSPKVHALIAKGMAGTKANRMADIEKAIQNSGPQIVKKMGDTGADIGPKVNELPKTSKLYNILSNSNPLGRKDNCKELSVSNACKAFGKDVSIEGERFSGNIEQLFSEKYGLNNVVKSMEPQSSNADEIKAQVERYILRKNKEGSVGVIAVGYSDSYKARVKEALGVEIEGHAFNYAVENGKVTFACGQSGYPKDESGIFKHINSGQEILLAEITEEIADIIAKKS